MNGSQALPVIAAAVAGAALVLQGELLAGISRANGLLGAVLTNTLVGVVVLAVLVAFTAPTLPMLIVQNFRWWHVVPGLLGTFFVYATVLAYARLGPVAAASLIIAAQLVAACVADFAGLASVSHALSLTRLAGAALVMTGALLALPR